MLLYIFCNDKTVYFKYVDLTDLVGSSSIGTLALTSCLRPSYQCSIINQK